MYTMMLLYVDRSGEDRVPGDVRHFRGGWREGVEGRAGEGRHPRHEAVRHEGGETGGADPLHAGEGDGQGQGQTFFRVLAGP